MAGSLVRPSGKASSAIAVATLLLTASLVAAPAAASPPSVTAAPSGGLLRVTLLTGDVVTVTEPAGGKPTFTVDAAEGRTVDFHSEWRGHDYYVIPSDARTRIATGSVDRELFNVKRLARQGLANSGAALPVIVTYPDAGARDRSELPATRRVRLLPAVNGEAMEVDRSNARAFWSALGTRSGATVWLDELLRITLDHSVPMIGAPQAWQAGKDGTGVKVAVLDTGVDDEHPDLAGKVTAAKDFTGAGSVVDGHGHGTHVAAAIAGTGAASGGARKGVAPGATLASGKVCDDEGVCESSAILAGMDWAARSGARVVNMSLGGATTDGRDPLSQAVNRLTAQTGALFVIAAGNSYCVACVGTPAVADSALAVGAVDKSDKLAAFSSRGPRSGDAAVKPEIVAPGVAIGAARAAGTAMGTPINDRYTSASGTSMATPHVAGAAAILAQARPAAKAYDLKQALVATAKDDGYTIFEQGAGRIDVARALTSPLSAPPTLNFGKMATAGTRTVTYTNSSSEPVALTLTMTMELYSGQVAPGGVANLSTRELTVPARGSAAALLTIRPYSGPTGVYRGVVTATGAKVSLRTPVSFYRADPTVPLTVRLLGFDGQPAPGDGSAIIGGASSNPNVPFRTDPYQSVALKNGVGTAHVPTGRYTTFAGVRDAVGQRAAWVAATDVPVDRAATILLDARKAVPAKVITAEPTDVVSHQLVLTYYTPTGGWSSAIDGRDVAVYATPAAAVEGPAKLVLQDNYTLTQKVLAGNPGTIYNLSYSIDDGIPATLERTADPAGLTAIKTTYHADVPDLKLTHVWLGFRAGSSGVMARPTIILQAPAVVTEYVNRDDRVTWTRYSKLSDTRNNNYALYSQGPFRATEHWFEGPVAPTVPGFTRDGTDGLDLLATTGHVNDSVAGHMLEVDNVDYPLTWKLFRGDTQIPADPNSLSRIPAFPVPDGKAGYRLEASLALPAPGRTGPNLALRKLSPRVDNIWTFTSTKATSKICTPTGSSFACDIQPLLQLSHELGLDPQNRAPAGVEHTVGFAVAHPAGAVGSAPAAGSTLSYSTDEGATWQQAPVTTDGAGRWKATVRNPAAGFVWLRAEAWDTAGNRVTQTVHRAYAVSP